MFIAMNRFRVVKGSEDAFENVWLSRVATSTRCRGLWNSTCSKVRRPKIIRSMPPTPYGRAGPRSMPGPDPRHFGPLTMGPDRTSPSTSAIPNSRASRFASPSALARRQRRGLKANPRSIPSADKRGDRATDVLAAQAMSEKGHAAVHINSRACGVIPA